MLSKKAYAGIPKHKPDLKTSGATYTIVGCCQYDSTFVFTYCGEKYFMEIELSERTIKSLPPERQFELASEAWDKIRTE